MTKFEAACREFIASRGSPRTRTAYLGDLRRWLDYCEERGADPAAPTLTLSSSFRDELQETFAPLTVRRVLSSLSKMYRRAVAREDRLASWNPFDPDALDRPPDSSEGKTELVSAQHARAILAEADADDSPRGRRDAAIIHLIHATGMRRMSAVGLRRNDVIERSEQMVVRVPKKGGGEQEIEVTDEAASAIRRWLEVAPASRWLFSNLRSEKTDEDNAKDRRLSGATVNEALVRLTERAGTPHVHPHQFRASLATDALDAGVPLRDVQAMLGHADPKTTLRYDRGRRGAGVAATVAQHRDKK